MNLRRRGIRLLPTLLASALLAACATGPVKPPPAPAVVIAHPDAPPTTLAPLVPARDSGDAWAELSSGLVLHDCADSPLIRANAAMYTQSPVHFQQLLAKSLPLMLYVHEQLQAAGIPGEFVMLPMLESSYDASEFGHASHGAGMWQLVPQTARLHGMVVTRQYDGRLDPVASTRAAIKMLQALDKQFGDWRLVDMAYNAGPYAVLGAMRDHPELGDGAIPAIPMSQHTRTHLARLLALSCILREPERFDVELPNAPGTNRLQAIEVPAGSALGAIAKMAEITESQLRALNPGYHGKTVPADSPRTLLLPTTSAQSLVAALAVASSESVAQVTSSEGSAGPSDNVPLPAEPVPPPTINTPTATKPTTHHRVRKGDTLWSIAHRYHVSVAELKRWNDLRDSDLRTGEELRIRG